MSSRPAIIALLLCILLAIGAYFVIKPTGGTGGGGGSTGTGVGVGERLTVLDLATVTSFTLQVPPSEPQTVAKSTDGTWQWKAKPTDDRQYALDDSNLRAFFRKIAENKTIAAPPAGEGLPDKPAPVTLTFRAKSGDTVIRLAPRALGGQVLADVKETGSAKPRTLVIGEDLLTLLTSPGPSAWRDTRALPADAALAARITFTDGTATKGFGLARREGRYVLTPPSPVTAAADFDVVNNIVRTINSVSITRFFDDASLTPKATGLDAPTGILTLEFDDRSIDAASQQPVVTTRTLRLTLGQPADAGGTTLFASTDGGKTVFAVGAAPLAGLTGPVSNLVARNPSTVPPADVGQIQFTSADGKHTLRLSRDNSTGTARWTESLNGSEGVTQSAEEAQACETILSTLTATVTDTVSLEPPKDAASAGVVSLASSSGQPLDNFSLMTTPSGALAIVTSPAGTGGTTTNGAIYRLIARPPAQLMAKLSRLQH